MALQAKRKKGGAIASLLVVRSLLGGFVPGLGLRILLAVMPGVLRAMVCRSGAVSKGNMDAQVSSLYFFFQVGTQLSMKCEKLYKHQTP